MTTYNTDQTSIYNLSVKRFNDRKKKMTKFYQESFERIENMLANIQIKKTEGIPYSEFQEERLQRILKQIDNEIRQLRLKVAGTIKSGMIENFQNTYLDTAYILEREVNLGAAFKNLKFDISFNYPIFPREVIQAALIDERIGGLNFTDRMLREQRQLQYQIRAETAQAIVEGIPVKEFEKRIGDIKDSLGKSTARVQATARTEMLRAYSIGQQEAIDIAEDSGLEGRSIWHATLDGRTRDDHVSMDGKAADENGVFTLPDGSTGKYPRDSSLSAQESINCRCRKLFEPFSITPTIRASKQADGSWKDVSYNMNAREWRKTREGKETVEIVAEQRKRRAKRLAKKRAA